LHTRTKHTCEYTEPPRRDPRAALSFLGAPMALTDKQRRFVEEYLVDLNATQAAIRAGYSANTAASQGERLLRNAEIRTAIERAQAERSQRTRVTADRVIAELARMALYDPADIAGAEIASPADIAKLPEAVRRAIIGWSWDKQGRFTLKLSPKTPSLDLLGRHLGLFKDRMELTGSNGGPVQTSIEVRFVRPGDAG